MRFLLKSILITAALSPFSALSAQAALVKDASLASACRGDVPVVVHSGMGAAIDFTQTGKVVQRAWLGDPSKVTLDTDRPLEAGSSVLFLRRIEGLDFSGLPATATTVLTTVLIEADGSEVCQFPISYSSSAPTHTSLRLLPDSSPATGSSTASAERNRPSLALLRSASLNLDHVESGINLNAPALGESNQVVIKVRAFIARARAGGNQQSIAQEMGIEWPLLVELRRQGEETKGNGTYAETSIYL